MKKIFDNKVIFIFISIITLLFSLSSVVMATNDVTTNSTEEDILASYETDYSFASSDLLLFDSNIEISQIVDGNVFAYGGTVNVTGEIYGDLLVFSNSLNVSSDAIIHGNIFAISNNITISGLASDIYAISYSSFTLEEESIIARNLNIISNSVSLIGQVSRDANIYTNSLNFADNAREVVKGNLNYISTNEAQIPDEAISGETKYTPINVDYKTQIINIITNIISALIYSFVFIMLTIWISPKFKDRIFEIVSKKSFKAFGIGLLVFFGAIILIFILLLFTYGLGTTVGVATIGLLALTCSISNTVFSMSISKIITNKLNWNKNTSFVLFSLLFVLIITLIGYIPYIGSPISFITSIIGLGTICINAYKRKDLVNTETQK